MKSRQAPTNAGAESRPARAEACAVMVTYHPDDGLPARLQRILPQVSRLIIVDNGSAATAVAMLRGAVTSAVTLIEHAENLGIASALNSGVRHALSQGYAWAVLLDQDSEVDADLVATLCATRASHPDADRLAVVGSRFRDRNGRPPETRGLGTGATWREVEAVITSGSLLALDIYAAIGPFRDEFFIDYVDIEYCYRARAAGYAIIETLRPLMSHTVGAPTFHRLLGGRRWTTNHSAERRYYIARNNTVLLREYGLPNGGSWRLKSLQRCWRLCKRILLFENDKRSKLLAVGQGWWDGMRGHLGPRARTQPAAPRQRPGARDHARR